MYHKKGDEEINTDRSQLKPYETQGTFIWCDLSTSTPRPYIPEPLCRRIFDMFPDILHPGPTPTVRLIKARCFWPDMKKNIRSLVKDRLRCQQHKISGNTRTETTPFSLPSGRFETAHYWSVTNHNYSWRGIHITRKICTNVHWQRNKMDRSHTRSRHFCHHHRINIFEYMGFELWSPITHCHRSRKSVWKWTV